jgi:hypothetical protein
MYHYIVTKAFPVSVYLIYTHTYIPKSYINIYIQMYNLALQTYIYSKQTCARLKIKSVFLGYEKSADFGNGININGNEINHQFDKSSNFLKLFNIYIKKFILYDIKLNSNINHLWEIEIMRIFCMEKSLKVFIHICVCLYICMFIEYMYI